MAEYVRFRMAAARVGASMALLALVAGVADKARAASHPPGAQTAVAKFLKLGGLTKTISYDFNKLEKKLITLDTAFAKIEKKLTTAYYTKAQSNKVYLKIRDANAKFLKVDATAADSNKLGGVPASGFLQGKGNVVSGAVPSVGTRQQLLSLPGGIIVVSVENTPGAGSIIVVHNATPNTLVGAVDMGDRSVSRAITLKSEADTLLPAVQTQSSAEIHLQIFPGGTFTNVVSILIGLTPNPTTQVPEAVAQAFTGGV
jgi:hypothetical protein